MRRFFWCLPFLVWFIHVFSECVVSSCCRSGPVKVCVDLDLEGCFENNESPPLTPFPREMSLCLDIVHELCSFWASNLKSEIQHIYTYFFPPLPKLTRKTPPLHSCYLARLPLWRLSMQTKWTRSGWLVGFLSCFRLTVGTLLKEVGFYELFEMEEGTFSELWMYLSDMMKNV